MTSSESDLQLKLHSPQSVCVCVFVRGVCNKCMGVTLVLTGDMFLWQAKIMCWHRDTTSPPLAVQNYWVHLWNHEYASESVAALDYSVEVCLYVCVLQIWEMLSDTQMEEEVCRDSPSMDHRGEKEFLVTVFLTTHLKAYFKHRNISELFHHPDLIIQANLFY